jgi:hypothetical protein
LEWWGMLLIKLYTYIVMFFKNHELYLWAHDIFI